MKNQLTAKKHNLNVFTLMVVLLASPAFALDELDDIHESIKQKYNVEHIDNQALSAQSSDSNFILFDVRERQEYDVSHIENAIQVDPEISVEEFFVRHTDKLDNKVVVFYCSVGERSSKLLEKLQDKLTGTGATSAYNLEGGAFKWHNDQIELVKDGLHTRDIHPYNAYWGQLIEAEESISYR